MTGILTSIRRSHVFCTFIVAIAVSTAAWAQHGTTGKVAVTVLDPSGGVVQGAQLDLQDLATNSTRTAQTQDAGTYTFVNLPLGTYKLTVSKGGFKSQVVDTVIVQAAQTTDINATLQVGALNETVEVTAGAAPLVETTSNAIATTIDLKQIEDLPMQGRDLSQLTQLVPGYTGTWDGLPSVAQGSNIDGVIGSSSRMKFGGNAAPAVTARLENIQEMTVQTDQLDLNQGFGTANMQTTFVTRRGTNAYHGRVFEDFRNSALNANSWTNDASGLKKDLLILNEFGGSLGGPIIKDKLFFFGNFSMSKQPSEFNAFNYVLTPAAQSGLFTYTDTNNQTRQVNVLQIGGNSGNPSTVNSQTASTLQAINGVLSNGQLSANADPNLQTLRWKVPAPITNYYPAVRVDYNANQKMRFNLAWNETKTVQPGVNTPNFPGSAFAGTGAGNKFLNYTTGFGFDWTISPTVVNEFRGGFLYTYNGFAYNAAPLTLSTQQIGWNWPSVPYPLGTQMNGTNFQIPTGSYYPLFNASDNVTLERGAHTLNFGFSWWREQDHYYNGVQGFPVVNLGLSNGDPALNAFTNGASGSVPNASSAQLGEAEQMYAILVGRIGSVNGQYAYNSATGNYFHTLSAYNLDELQKAWGLFFQDSYRIKPSFTLNYGLRWDFTGADKDLTGLYHSLTPAGIWGPSGVGNLFNPGSLKGDMNPMISVNPHPYNDWNVSPQPAIGIAWNPHSSAGFLSKLLGGDNTVIRAGFSLRKFTEPQQYVWNQASDYGSFYYQSFFLNPNTTGQPGTFTPGTLSLGDSLTNFGYSPQSFLKSEPAADFTFINFPGINGVDPHLKQPYTQAWNLGIQRQLGSTRALEIRYIGSRTVHQWVTIDPNEVNVFENGFLTQFKAAQQNLAINNANGFSGSFANNNLPGQAPLPVFDAAFAGEASGPAGSGIPLADYGNSRFLNDLSTGQVGDIANVLAGIGGPVPYFCNLVGAGFTPCATNAGFTGPGAGYPINYFQANPYAAGAATGYLTHAGYSNYNGLQVDFRQRAWHGLQFDANYTWSHTLGLATQNNWQGTTAVFTLRNMRLAYGPTLYDLRHVANVNGTFDLPFGRGKEYLNKNGVLDKVVGGWTVGTILTFQTGTPFLLQGGDLTYNDYGDGGILLNGVTPGQLQSSIGVYHIKDPQTGQLTPNVSFINPKYLASPTGGGANSAYISANTVPGSIGQRVWLYGPHFINDDLSITKRFPIRESIRFIFQVEMLNAFNHPNFQPGAANGCIYYCFSGGFSPGVQQSNFGIGGISPNYNPASPNQGARVIELRANLEF